MDHFEKHFYTSDDQRWELASKPGGIKASQAETEDNDYTAGY